MVVYNTGFLRFFLVVLINCIYFGAYSQVIPLTDKEFSKQNSITLIKSDIYDISGSVTRGYLYHVSDSVIFLSNYSRDTVYAFHANDIHRLSVYRGRGLSAASAVTFGISNLVVLNWAFASGDFLTHLLIGNTFLAIPLASVPLIINGLVNPDLDFETETLASNHVVLVYLKEYVAAPKFKWDSPIERKDLNQKAVDQFSKPPRHKHPQSTSRFFYQFNLPPRYQLFGTNMKSIREPNSQLDRDINNRKVSYHTDFSFGIRVLPKINIA